MIDNNLVTQTRCPIRMKHLWKIRYRGSVFTCVLCTGVWVNTTWA